MKLISVFIIALSLSGCGQTITQKDIDRANRYCEDKEGVYSITDYGALLTGFVDCKNGVSTLVNKIREKGDNQ